MLSGSKIDPSSLTTAAQNAITKASNISVTNGRIDLSSLSTSVVNSSGLATTLADYALISIVPTKISALTFDSFGNASKVQIAPTKITIGSSGSLEFSASGNSSILMNNSGVAITGNKYIKLDVSNDNYVHIDQTGIVMKGTRVTIIDGDGVSQGMWGRDDIIVMNPNASESWRRTESGIATKMSGKHDWVLVKPYYDSSITGTGKTGAATTQSIINSDYTVGAGHAFGNGSSWYQYDVSVSVRNDASQYRQCTVVVYFANKPFYLDQSSSQTYSQQALAQCVTYTYTVTGDVGANNTHTFSLTTGHVSENLCSEGQKVYYVVTGLGFASMYLVQFIIIHNWEDLFYEII